MVVVGVVVSGAAALSFLTKREPRARRMMSTEVVTAAVSTSLRVKVAAGVVIGAGAFSRRTPVVQGLAALLVVGGWVTVETCRVGAEAWSLLDFLLAGPLEPSDGWPRFLELISWFSWRARAS